MKKRILAAILAMSIVLGMTACNNSGAGTADGGNSEQSSNNGDSGAEETTAFDYSEVKNDDKTLIWMSHYDVNPEGGADRSPELALFEDTYGGKIVYQQTTWDARFDDLASSIVADQSPDLFPYEWIAFPNGIMKGQYQSIDSIVDWDSDLWKDMKKESDAYVYKGQHYVAPYEIIESLLLIYDKTLVEDEGLQDPYELYQAGNWTWDEFKSMMETFCANGEDRIGCMNAFGRSLVMSTGETFVTFDGTSFKNNVTSANIDRVQEFISGLAKEGLTGDGSYITADQAFKNDSVLFYGSGNWDIDRALKIAKAREHEMFVVTMPRDPESDNYYVAENLQADMWVAGSTKADLVKTWFECRRTVKTDAEYLATAKETKMAASGWSSEIYDAVMDIRSDKFIKVFDYGYGISDSVSTIIEDLYNGCCFNNDKNTGWANMRDSVSGQIQAGVDDVNARFTA